MLRRICGAGIFVKQSARSDAEEGTGGVMLQAVLSAVLGLALMVLLLVGLLSVALVLLVLGVAVLGGLGRVVLPDRRRHLRA